MRYRWYILYFFLGCHIAHAERISERLGIDVGDPSSKEQRIPTWLKKGLKIGLKWIPGGDVVGELVDLDGDLEAKVDRIEQKQTTALDHIRDIAKKALKTKDKVEEMYYFKKRSQRRAEEISERLKRSKKRKFLGALLEGYLGFPINPAAYLPDTEYTQRLKKNLELDLSLEQGLLQEGNYLLSDTRAALIESGLVGKPAVKFEQEYQQAVAYEQKMYEALLAKKNGTLKLYKEEIGRLEQELKFLEKAKAKKGLTVSDVMQIEQTIELKRGVIRELNEKITLGLEAGLGLTDAQQAKLMDYKAAKDTQALEAYLVNERKRRHARYEHLWRFW